MSISSAVDGLVSGLDTSNIIKSLLAVDAAPQTKLKNQVSAEQARVSAYQSVNSKLAALQSAAAALQKASGWNPMTAKSADPTITVTTTSATPPMAFDVTVNSMATGRAVTTDLSYGPDDVVGFFPMDFFRQDGSFVTVRALPMKDMDSELAKLQAIGINATKIKQSDGKYKVYIESSRVGGDGVSAPGDFGMRVHTANNVLQPDGSTVDTHASSGSDGKSYFTTHSTDWNSRLAESVHPGHSWVQNQPANVGSVTTKLVGQSVGTTHTVMSNTLVEPFTGVTLGFTQTGPTARVTVARDPAAVGTAMQALVDAANAALTEIATQTRAGVVGSTGASTGAGALRGDAAVRGLTAKIIESVTYALGGSGAPSTSAATLGVESTRAGKLTFDKAKFEAALAKDPAGVQKLIAPQSLDAASTATGLVERLTAVTTSATKAATGSITTAIQGSTTTISRLQKQVDDWSARLESKRERYQAYCSRLEASLGKLKGQSTWLSGQLAGMSG